MKDRARAVHREEGIPVFRIALLRGLAVGAALLGADCNSSMMDSGPGAQLLSVSPLGGAMSVAPGSNIVITFGGAMMAGMEEYMALHADGVAGPSLPMTCTWSDGRRTLTCRPDQPLAAASRYAIHLGGGMMDAEGCPVGMDRYGMGMGGEWATGHDGEPARHDGIWMDACERLLRDGLRVHHAMTGSGSGSLPLT